MKYMLLYTFNLRQQYHCIPIIYYVSLPSNLTLQRLIGYLHNNLFVLLQNHSIKDVESEKKKNNSNYKTSTFISSLKVKYIYFFTYIKHN